MSRSSKTIKIYDKNSDSINPIFVKGNRIVIKKYQHILDKIKEDFNKTKELKKLWLEEFNAKLVTDRSTNKWREIKFRDIKDKTIFLFRIID